MSGTYFSRSMRFLSVSMETWTKHFIKRINTQNRLGYVLVWKGGISNILCQVLKVNRLYLYDIQKMFHPANKKLISYLTCINQVMFLSTSRCNMSTSHVDLMKQLTNLKMTIAVSLLKQPTRGTRGSWRVKIFCAVGERSLRSTKKN